MKLQKQIKIYCVHCKKHTVHNAAQMKAKTRSGTHPLSHGSTPRLRMRGQRRGAGSLGRYSKPAISKFKRSGAKISKVIVVKLQCSVCKKSSQMTRGRAKKFEAV